jgi:hypothetical protein
MNLPYAFLFTRLVTTFSQPKNCDDSVKWFCICVESFPVSHISIGSSFHEETAPFEWERKRESAAIDHLMASVSVRSARTGRMFLRAIDMPQRQRKELMIYTATHMSSQDESSVLGSMDSTT